MANSIATGAVHHLALTVTDLRRAREFYTGLLGFQTVMELSPSRVLIGNGSSVLALSLPPDPSRAPRGDRFDENRVGLDHLCFSVAGRSDLERAARVFDERGVSHGEIEDLGKEMRMYTMAFRDPDNTQLELTAPYAG
jgi:glyoxylase I family protein